MKEPRPAMPRHMAGHRTLGALLAALLTNSLVLYITADALHRLWTLLNSDVMQLIRRVH
jgi:hypothetical protein